MQQQAIERAIRHNWQLSAAPQWLRNAGAVLLWHGNCTIAIGANGKVYSIGPTRLWLAD